jgi:hypothetical protein
MTEKILPTKGEFKEEMKNTIVAFYKRCQNPKDKHEERENKIILGLIIFTIVGVAITLIAFIN